MSKQDALRDKIKAQLQDKTGQDKRSPQALSRETMAPAETVKVSSHVEAEVLLQVESSNYDYSQVSRPVRLELRHIRDQLMAYDAAFKMKVGMQLKKAHDLLADYDNRKGGFMQWCEMELGLKYRTAKRLIERYELAMSTESDERRKLIEHLPTRLIEALLSKNTPDHIKESILNNEIRTSGDLQEVMHKNENALPSPKYTVHFSTAMKRYEEHATEVNQWASRYGVDNTSEALVELFKILYSGNNK